MFDAQDDSIDAREKLYDFHINDTRYEITHGMQDMLADSVHYKSVLGNVLATVNRYRTQAHPEYRLHFSISMQNLLMLYKYGENWLDAAKISEELFELNKNDSLKVALISLVDSYHLYKICSKNDEAVRVYKAGATMFFKGCEPFYKYVFSKALKDIKSIMSDIQELINLSK